jgi:Flp pilus assembly pilin Flp
VKRRGQAIVEYGLLLALIVLVTLLGANAFGRAIRHWFDTLAQQITTQNT